MDPPFVGFRHHLLPMEIIRLLKKKRRNPDLSLRKINEFDIYKLDPFELPGLSKSKSDQQVWNFFCEPRYKNANRNRLRRKAKTGTWKVTCKNGDVKDENGAIVEGCKRRTLVFYKRGFSSKQAKTDWFMYEFYVKDCPRYKKDYVFCCIKKNPKRKSNVSTHDDGQPSHLASDSETHVPEKTSTEVSSSHHLTVSDSGKHDTGKKLLEVESQLQLNHNLDSNVGNHFRKSTSVMVEPQLQLNDNLVFDPRNYFAKSTSTMIESHLQLNNNLVSNPGNLFPKSTSTMVESRLVQFNDNLVSNFGNYFPESTSTMVEPRLLQLNDNLVSDFGNYFLDCTSTMVEPRLLQSNDNLVNNFGNYFPESTSVMVEARLLQLNDNLVFDFRNYFPESNSTMVEPRLLQLNDNLIFNFGNYFPESTSTMVEPQLLLSDDNLVFDLGNHLSSNTSSMVKPQLPFNHNLVSDTGNHYTSNSYSMVDPPELPALLAESDAVHGCYWLNHGSVSAPQSPINPEQGPYDSSYSNGFVHDCTVWSPQFDAPWKIQDEYPCEVTEQTLSADTDTETINALIDDLFVDIPPIACVNHN